MKSEDMFKNFRQSRKRLECPKCSELMDRVIYAKSMVLHGCKNCNKAYMRQNGRFVELAFKYNEFTWD